MMREIHFRLKEERNKEELRKIETIENFKNDSNRMFKAIRLINKDKPKEKNHCKDNADTITNETEVTKQDNNIL